VIERKRWLILTAVVAEAKPIARALGVPYRVGFCQSIDETKEGVAGLHVIGVGARALPNRDLPWDRVAGIVLAGFAGGLDPELKVGDVVVEGMPPALADALPAKVAAFHTATQLISTADQKAELRAETGAAAVEMEGAAVRELARAVGVPFVQVRAISDTADDALDARILRGVDPFGRLRAVAMTGIVLRHPLMLRGLLRLGAHARVAGRRLADVVGRLVQLHSPP
jgi:adenosylhomocysteine nucleosidase